MSETPAEDAPRDQSVEATTHLPAAPPKAVVGPPGKVRRPVGGWLLALVTLGVYVPFWYFHLNRELRDFDPSVRVRPGWAVVCLFVPVVNLVSIHNTGTRIRQAQTAAGAHPDCSGVIGLLLSLVAVLDVAYYNAAANQAWQGVSAARAGA